MRSTTSGQLSVLNSTSYQVGLRVLIADGDGVMRDYSAHDGRNAIDSVEIDVDVDQPVGQATIRLLRDVIDGSGNAKSLSPFRSDSTWNRNGVGAFSPAIDAGRAVRILVATIPVGGTFVTGDWQNVFEGTLDEFDIAKSPLVLTARDLSGTLVDSQIETEKSYGSQGGVAMETVMQQILDDTFGSGVVQLYCPVSPNYLIKPYAQSRQSVMEALLALAGLVAWDIRYRWDSATSAWRLTLAAPPRSKTTPDRTIGPARYIDITQLKLGRMDVRNALTLKYLDSATQAVTPLTRTDNASIAKYGRRWMEINEATNSPIDTAAEATAMADGILADLKDPKADQSVEMHFDWSIEMWDLLRFSPNSVHYDADQDWAVVSVRHALSSSSHRTSISVRGKPCGRYLGWIARAHEAVSVVPPAAKLTLIPSIAGLPRAVGVVASVDMGTASSVRWTLTRQVGTDAAAQVSSGTYPGTTPALPLTVSDNAQTTADTLYTFVVVNPVTAVASVATVAIPRLAASVYATDYNAGHQAAGQAQRGHGGLDLPNVAYTTVPLYDGAGFQPLVDTGASKLTSVLLAADGRSTPTSTYQSTRDAAYASGNAATGITAEGSVRSGQGGLPLSGLAYTTTPLYDGAGFQPLIDPAGRKLTAVLLAADGRSAPTSTYQSTRDAANASGNAATGITAEGDVRSGQGGLPLSGQAYTTISLMDPTGFITYIDTVTGRVSSSLAGPTGTSFTTIERGGSKGDAGFTGSGVLASGVVQSDSQGGRVMIRGRQTGQCRHDDPISFSPHYENIPIVRISGGALNEPRNKWGPNGSGSETGAVANTPQYEDFGAVGLSTSGFTMRARLRQKGATIVTRTDTFSGTTTISALNDTTSWRTTVDAPASDGVYRINGSFTSTISRDLTNQSGSYTVTISIECDTGTGPTEVATRSFPNTTNSNGNSTVNNTFSISITKAGLSSTSAFRVKVKAVTQSNIFSSGFTVTAESVQYSDTTAGADQFASKTPDTDDLVTWEAYDASIA